MLNKTTLAELMVVHPNAGHLHSDEAVLEAQRLHGHVQPALSAVRVTLTKQIKNGKPKVSFARSERHECVRASGKRYQRWSVPAAHVMQFTREGLLMHTVKNSKGYYHRYIHQDDNLTPIGNVTMAMTGDTVRSTPHATPGSLVEQAMQEFAALTREADRFEDRFPLIPRQWCYSPTSLRPFLDATDYRQVSGNLFGSTRVTKALTKEVERLVSPANLEQTMRMLHVFRMFRGLVPTDWIIDTMRETFAPPMSFLKSGEERTLRSMLRLLPQPLLRRLLLHGNLHHFVRVGKDIAMFLQHDRDMHMLPGLIAARKQKNIRDIRDLEQLVLSIPARPRLSRRDKAIQAMVDEGMLVKEMHAHNMVSPNPLTWDDLKDTETRQRMIEYNDRHERERRDIDARRRAAEAEQARKARMAADAKRAQWAEGLSKELDGLSGDGWSITVATSPEKLALWGREMGNCIGGYQDRLGLDVLAAVSDDTGQRKLNMQITMDGIQQMLGKFNKDAARCLSRAVLSDLLAALDSKDVRPCAHALGVPTL